MRQPQFFQIAQAAPAGRHFPIDRGAEAAAFARKAAECLDEADVADHVDHLAVDGGGLVGEVMVQRLAGGGDAEHRHDDDAGDNHEDRGHPAADQGQIGDCAHSRDAGRHYIPDEHVFNDEDGVRRGGDAARQHARQAFGEIAWRVASEVPEKVGTKVAGNLDEGGGGDPACHAP
jgi:hypothetical protein